METTKQIMRAAGIGAAFSVGAILNAGLCSLISKTSKVAVLSLLKSSWPLAMVGGIVFTAVAYSYDAENFLENGFDDTSTSRGLLGRIAGAFAVTVLLSPIISGYALKYIPCERINYIQAGAITAMGITTGMGILGGTNAIRRAFHSDGSV